MVYLFQSFPKRQILASSKLIDFADDNFKFDENDRKFSKRLENTEGKEKCLVTSNFSFSCSVFTRAVLQTRKNQGLFGKGLKKDPYSQSVGVFGENISQSIAHSR